MERIKARHSCLAFICLTMKDYEEEFKVVGAPVIFTTERPRPKNPLHRPSISYKKPIFCMLTYVFALIVLFVFCRSYIKWILMLAFSVIYISIISRKSIIWLVHLYQSKAPDETRLKCVFEPSCSEYMILAVEKYGSFVGCIKGIKRILRCHPPNGGLDYP